MIKSSINIVFLRKFIIYIYFIDKKCYYFYKKIYGGKKLKAAYIIASIFLIIAASIYRFDVDKKFFNIIHTERKTKVYRIFKTITDMGSVWFISLSNILLLFLLNNNYKSWSYFIPITTAICSIANSALKLVFKRKRPKVIIELVKENSYSFPSGHSMVSACFYTLLSTFLSTLVKTHIIFAIGGIIILLIAYSRVYLGVHYPVDVITGVGLGLLIAMIGLDVLQHFMLFVL